MPAHIVVRPVIGGIARDDAVVIAGITLRFDESFMAALRAAVEVGMRWVRCRRRL